MKLETIVVGTDGSANARVAVESAADLAAGSGGTVHVVCAFDPVTPHDVADILSQLPNEFHDSYDPETEYRRIVAAAGAYLDSRGIPNKAHLVTAHPVTAILETADAEDADLVVVGNRGAGFLTRAVRGSVSTRVASHATRNLLVVHEPPATET